MRLADIRIATKLGLCLSVGLALVGGMIVNEQISTSSIEALTAAADREQAIAVETINSDSVLRQAQIVSRDLRMARSKEQAETVLSELQRIARDGNARFAALQNKSASAQNLDRF